MIAGFNPHSAYSGGGTTDDLTAITAALQATTNTISIVASDPYCARVGNDTGAFTITRSGKLNAITVNYTVSGTAAPGSDYTALSGTVSLPFGINSAIVTVTPNPNGTPSTVARTIVTTLSASANYTIGSPANATVTFDGHWRGYTCSNAGLSCALVLAKSVATAGSAMRSGAKSASPAWPRKSAEATQ